MIDIIIKYTEETREKHRTMVSILKTMNIPHIQYKRDGMYFVEVDPDILLAKLPLLGIELLSRNDDTVINHNPEYEILKELNR